MRVPTLAGLRQLEAVGPAPGKGKPAAEWNPIRGGLFVVGTVLALLGLVVGGYASMLVKRVNLKEIQEHVGEHDTAFVEEVDSMSLEKLYDEWKVVSAQPPGMAGSSISVQAQSFVDFWTTVSIVSFSTAAVGILLAGGSLLGRK